MVIFYVNVIEQNAGWGAECFVNRGFQFLGHTTHCLDYRRNRFQLCRHFLQAPKCHALLLQRGDYFPLGLLRAVQVPRFFWASELFTRCPDQYRLFRSGLFQHVFVHTRQCIEAILSRSWLERERLSVLLNGFDETLHRKLPHMSKDIDVLFVGTLTPRRRSILDRLRSWTKVTVASAFGEELTRLFNRSRIVLNIHAEEFADTETRVFEALGCGAFLLTERLSPENPFSDRDLVQSDSLEGLVGMIEYYLAHEEEREAIASHGHRTALDGHTYIHRARQIVEVMSKYVNRYGGEALPAVRRSLGLALFGVSERARLLGSQWYRKSRALVSKAKAAVRALGHENSP